MSIDVFVPGRIALLGEHNDWAGGASLALPLPLGVRVQAEPGLYRLELHTTLEGQVLTGAWAPEGEVDPAGGPLRMVPAAAAVLRDHGMGPPPARLWVSSTLPAGRGFSSSAALCGAVLDALARLAGHALPAVQLAELAYEVEHDRLGVACGRLDQLATLLGRGDGQGLQAVLLRWADGQPTAAEAVRPAAPLHLAIGAFPTPRDTPGILQTLNRWHSGAAGDPEGVAAVRACLARWGEAAVAGAEQVRQGDLRALGQALSEAQRRYEVDLAARLPALAAPGLIRATRALSGSLGAKFSGAGGDGSIIALYADAAGAEQGRSILADLGLAAWAVRAGPQG